MSGFSVTVSDTVRSDAAVMSSNKDTYALLVPLTLQEHSRLTRTAPGVFVVDNCRHRQFLPLQPQELCSKYEMQIINFKSVNAL